MSLLEIDNLDVFYGDFQAIYSLDLHIAEGETLAVIGSNGAGKTTLMKAIAGLATSSSGEIRYRKLNIEAVKPFKRVEMGIALTPEGRKIFRSLTVEKTSKLERTQSARGHGTYQVFTRLSH